MHLHLHLMWWRLLLHLHLHMLRWLLLHLHLHLLLHLHRRRLSRQRGLLIGWRLLVCWCIRLLLIRYWWRYSWWRCLRQRWLGIPHRCLVIHRCCLLLTIRRTTTVGC